MTNQQQPECPADRVFPCPRCNGGGCFRCGDSGIANEADDYRARLEEAEARASAEAAKVERVKALLDGVGPVVSDLAQLRDAAHSVSDGDWKLDQSISGITTESGLCDIGFDLARWDAEFMVSAFNNLPALLSAISEVREVLKGV